MRTITLVLAAAAMLSGAVSAQEQKPVPKDSVRVAIPGCTKGYIFTAGRRTVVERYSLHVNAPKLAAGLRGAAERHGTPQGALN